MSEFLTAIALLLVIEGLLYAAFPKQMKRAIEQMLKLPDSELRVFAFIVAGIGLIALWFIKG